MSPNTRSSLHFVVVCLIAIAAAGVVAIAQAPYPEAELAALLICLTTTSIERSSE